MNFTIGEKVIIELEDECYIGDIAFINATRIDLDNVRDFKTWKPFVSRQIYFKNQIQSIKIVNNKNSSDISVPSACDPSKSHSSISEFSSSTQERNFANLTANELNKIQKSIDNIHYLYQTDQSYHKAIKDLELQSSVALNVENSASGRHSATTILTIATDLDVYIFDLILLGGIFKDLQTILEDSCPRKIVYNSAKIADNLKFKHNVKLNGVRDAFVAHVLISKRTEPITLPKCVALYINIPDEYFIEDVNVNWCDRPFDSTRKTITAKKTVLLFKLYDYLVDKKMLKTFTDECIRFTEFYRDNEDWTEVAMKISNSVKNEAAANITGEGWDQQLMEKLQL